MRANYETKFSTWASPPGTTEETKCANSINAIRTAISKSTKLNSKTLKVFIQGSYRNRVNVRHGSDVDIGVICNDVFLSQYPSNMTRESFGIQAGSYNISEFKNDLHKALISHFGAQQVVRGSKALNVKENTYRVDADVVPLFEFRRYWENGTYRAGVALWDDKKNNRIENYPERLFDYWPNTPLHYENGVSKNTATGRSFKSIVRIIKKLSIEMSNAGYQTPDKIPSYLIECLVYNTPNYCFQGSTWSQKVGSVLSYINSNITSGEWMEVDGIKYLFHSSQPWERNDAKAFISDAILYTLKSPL